MPRFDAFISYSRGHDALLGPALQLGLERFAKPWWRIRALRVFRDTANLAAGPDLLTSIEEALSSSDWFILLASAEAAESSWVNREVEWWLSHRQLERLLVVGTGPGLAWDNSRSDWAVAAPVPAALRGVMAAEPLWVDLADIRLDGRRSKLPEDRLASVAAAVRGVPRDSLIGEHLRQHRRVLRFAAAAVAVMAILTVLAMAASLIAIGQRNAALRQRDIAVSGQLTSESEAFGNANATVAALRSVAAWNLDENPQARYAMLVASSRSQIGTITASRSPLNSVAFGPNGKILATGGSDGTVRVWDLADGRQISAPLRAGRSIESVAFSPNGQLLAAGTGEGTAVLWAVSTHRVVHVIRCGASLPCAVAFNPSGQMLATGDGAASLWSVGTAGRVGKPFGLADHVVSVSFDKNGAMLATGGDDGRARLWKVADQRPSGRSMDAGTMPVWSLAFSPGGGILATGDGDGSARLWNVLTDKEIAGIPGDGNPVDSVAFSPSGSLLATANSAGATSLWNVATVEGRFNPGRVNDFAVGSGPVGSAVFSPNGMTLATGNWDGTVRLWNAAPDWQIGSRPSLSGTGPVNAAAFDPGKTLLATALNDGSIKLWSATTGHVVGRPIGVGAGNASTIAFGEHGKIIDALYGNVARAWSLASGQQIGGTVHVQVHDVFAAEFSAQGTMLAAGGDGGAEVLSMATGRVLDHIPSAYVVESVAFSPDSRTLAVGDADGHVWLWNLTSDREIGSLLPAGPGPVNSLAFSPDNGVLAAGNFDGSVQSWSVINRKPIGDPILTGPSPVDTVAFTPDGKSVRIPVRPARRANHRNQLGALCFAQPAIPRHLSITNTGRLTRFAPGPPEPAL